MNAIVSIIRLFQRIVSNELINYPNMGILSNSLKEALDRHTTTLHVDVFTDDKVYMALQHKIIKEINKEKAIHKLVEEIMKNGVYEVNEERTQFGFKTTYKVTFIKDMGL